MAFKITEFNYAELNFGKEQLLKAVRYFENDGSSVAVSFQDKDGNSSIVTYWLTTKDGAPSKSGLARLSTLYQESTHDYTSDEFEIDDIIGHYIIADVEESKSRKQDGTPYRNLTHIKGTDKKFEYDKKDELEEDEWA